VGPRALFYSRFSAGVAFASDVRALTQLPGVAAEVDPFGLACWWIDELGWAFPQATSLRGIQVVPPATVVRVRRDGSSRERRYWHLSTGRLLSFRDEVDAVTEFQAVFGCAVAAQLDEAAAPGLLLSGGIDSASVLAAARGFDRDVVAPLKTISGIAELKDYGLPDEVRNIRKLLESHPDHLTFVLPPTDRCGIVSSADAAEVAWSLPHPTHASTIVHGLGYRLAAQAGLDVMLDGVDGDVVTAPFADPIAALFRGGNIGRALAEARASALTHTHLRRLGHARILGMALMRALLPATLLAWRHSLSMDAYVAAFPFAPKLAASERLRDRFRAARGSLPADARQRNSELLPLRVTRSVSAAHMVGRRWGVESRHPWADLSVVQFFNSLPLEWRVRNGWTKYLVRRGCEEALGADVVWHTGKSHVGMALTEALVGDAAPYLCGVVERQRDALNELLKPHLVDEALSYLWRPAVGGDVDNAIYVAAMAGWLAGLKADDGASFPDSIRKDLPAAGIP